MAGIFDGEKAVEELRGGDFVEGGGVVGKVQRAVLVELDGEIAVAVFEGVVQDVGEHTREGVFIEQARDARVADLDLRRDAAGCERAVERSEAFCQGVVQHNRLTRQRFFFGEDDGIAEEFLGETRHGVGAVFDEGKVARSSSAFFFALEQIEVAVDRRQRRAQIVGNIRHGLLQFAVAVFVAQALAAQFCELVIQRGGDGAQRWIAAVGGEQGVAVGVQMVVEIGGEDVQIAPQQKKLGAERERAARKQNDEQPNTHGGTSLFDVFAFEEQEACGRDEDDENERVERPKICVLKHHIVHLHALTAWQKVIEKEHELFSEWAHGFAIDGDVSDYGIDNRSSDGEYQHHDHPADNRAGFVGNVHRQRDVDRCVGDGEHRAAEKEPAEIADIQRKRLKIMSTQHRAKHEACSENDESASAGDEPVREKDRAACVAADKFVADRSLVVIAADEKMQPDRVDNTDAGQHTKHGCFSCPGARCVIIERDHVVGGDDEDGGADDHKSKRRPKNFVAQKLRKISR